MHFLLHETIHQSTLKGNLKNNAATMGTAFFPKRLLTLICRDILQCRHILASWGAAGFVQIFSEAVHFQPKGILPMTILHQPCVNVFLFLLISGFNCRMHQNRLQWTDEWDQPYNTVSFLQETGSPIISFFTYAEMEECRLEMFLVVYMSNCTIQEQLFLDGIFQRSKNIIRGEARRYGNESQSFFISGRLITNYFLSIGSRH